MRNDFALPGSLATSTESRKEKDLPVYCKVVSYLIVAMSSLPNSFINPDLL